MIFALITLLAALSLAAVADWFSIIGFMAIYAANPMHALIMGIVLALAKLVTTSWVYRNWKFTNWRFKTPMIGFVIALMVATSIGTYGFLTKSHLDQGGSTIDNGAKVERLDQQIAREKSTISDDEKVITQLDATINSYIGKDRTDKSLAVRKSQAPQRKQLRDDIDSSQKRIDTYSDEKLKLQSEVRKQQLDVGPIRYIAELFYGVADDASKNIEAAVRLFTLLIVSTLDPLAVTLIVAANHTLLRLRDEKEEASRKNIASDTHNEPVDVGQSTNNKESSEEISELSDKIQAATSDEFIQQPATEEDAVPLPILPEIVERLDEKENTTEEKGDITTAPESRFDMEETSILPLGIEGTSSVEYNSQEISKVREVVNENETTSANNSSNVFSESNKLESTASFSGSPEADITDDEQHSPDNVQSISDSPQIQEIIHEEEAAILERFQFSDKFQEIAVIISPTLTKIQTGGNDSTTPETIAKVEDTSITPYKKIENTILREFLGSAHFIPQKVNEEEKYTSVEANTKTGIAEDETTETDDPKAKGASQEIEEISSEGQITREETQLLQTALKEQVDIRADHKYPVVLSWLAEFKRVKNG